MKKIFTFFLLVQSLISCSKKDVAAPEAALPQEQAIVYTDAHIAVKDFKAVMSAPGSVMVQFSTLYEHNIKQIEIMSGSTENQLCSMYNITKSTNSTQTLSYSILDPKPKNATSYYMIRYTLKSGDWGYTPVYKLKAN